MRLPTRSLARLPLLVCACASLQGGCTTSDAAPDTHARTVVAGAGPQTTLAADSAYLLEGLRHLSSDSLQGRGTGTEGAARARTWIVDALTAAGIEPVDGTWTHPFTWTGGGERRTGVNVLGVRPTTLPTAGADTRVIVVSAHYDHEGVRDGEIYNGADDDASGTVALVALARALRGVPLRHTLIFAAFDAEEAGLRGARAFVQNPPVPLDRVALDLNMDMVARTSGVLWAAGAHHTPALRPALEQVAAEAPLDLRLGHDAPGAPGGADWTNSSDHGPFHGAGIPFVYLGVEDHADYHRPTDDFANVDPGEYMDALRTVLATLLALDAALPLAPDGAGADAGAGR